MNPNRPVPPGLHLRKILVPTDFSTASAKALTHAQTLAKPAAAEIMLLHVVSSLYDYSVPSQEIIVDWVGVQNEMTSAAQAQLETFARAHAASFDPLRLIVREGLAWREIAETARQAEADLIVLSTHGRTGLSHVLLGSTAERVVRHATCPVLTVRDQ